MLNIFFRRAKPSGIMNIVKVDDSVLISLPSLPHNVYSSKIEAIDDKSISLSFPTKNGLKLPLQKKTILNVSVLTGKGMVTFISKVEDIVADKTKTLIIGLPDEFRSDQRRHYFRVSAYMQVTLFVPQNKSFFKASLMNLSGGGCLLRAGIKDTRIGDKLILDFSNTPINLQQVTAKIVRKGNNGTLALQFLMKEKERERIVRYVLQRQLELYNPPSHDDNRG